MNGIGSADAVIAAIREEAREEVERIDREAAATIARLRDAEAAAPAASPLADPRIASARRRARERLAEQGWADRQAALNAREAWIAAVAAAAVRRLAMRSPSDRRADLVALAHEAVERLGGVACDLIVAEADLPLVDEELSRELPVARWRSDPALAAEAGGCIAQTCDGRLRFDNTYDARVRRFEPLWRAALGELFDHAGVAHA